jgi:hypothetical protein
MHQQMILKIKMTLILILSTMLSTIFSLPPLNAARCTLTQKLTQKE